SQLYQLFSEYEHQKPMVAENVSSCVGSSSHSSASSGIDHEEDMEVDTTIRPPLDRGSSSRILESRVPKSQLVDCYPVAVAWVPACRASASLRAALDGQHQAQAVTPSPSFRISVSMAPCGSFFSSSFLCGSSPCCGRWVTGWCLLDGEAVDLAAHR
ncbi:hypothetical protein FCV25MIE_01650, partial [Fagus crenata]